MTPRTIGIQPPVRAEVFKRFALVLAACMVQPVGAPPAGIAAEAQSAEVFAAPEADVSVRAVMQEVTDLASAGRMEPAAERLRKALDAGEVPAGLGHYALACLHAAHSDTDGGMVALSAAAAAGFDDVGAIANSPDLQPLRGAAGFEEIAWHVAKNAATARRVGLPKPRPVVDRVALVAEENTRWLPQLTRFVVAHEFPPAEAASEICTQPGPVGELLRQWKKEGTAAGLHGVLYDNHDDDHSVMNVDWFPQLTRIRYCDAAKRARTTMHMAGELHRGLQILFLHNAPVIGNASVAATNGFSWRSMPRRAMAGGMAMSLLADQAANNMIYFYPEHRDHDPEAGGGYGDVYPANVPYLITSQGSSGSDRDFMNAVTAMIAAFRPETQRFLIEKHLLMPTVQMIFRSSRKRIIGRAEYLSGAAHPPVFDGATIDAERMVRMAHGLQPDEVPPMVRLKVEGEDVGHPGIDYFDAGSGERLFDTISAVARVARAACFRRRMVASVAGTEDPNGRPLSFVWKLLHGDEERVQIRPLDPLGLRAEILVDWHPRAVYPGSDLPSSRVDVGVFADNGARLSAPAFLTWYFPPNERRTYEQIPETVAADRRDEINGNSPQRIVSIVRLPATDAGSYVDPLIVTPADWADTYHYDDRGDLLGWTRSRKDRDEEFTPNGRVVVEKDAAGRAVKTRGVRYVREQAGPDAMPVLRQEAVESP
jgi:hypothetical protein